MPQGRLSWLKVETAIRESFGRSQFITFEEARARVGPLARRSWNQYFRADGTGPGVWVTCWSKGEEVVLTYLYPRPRPLPAKLQTLGMAGLLLPARRTPAGV